MTVAMLSPCPPGCTLGDVERR